MKIKRLDAQTVGILDLDDLLSPLLWEIVPSANPEGSEVAQSRLYSTPTAGVDPAQDEDWREYVEPDLREQFHSHLALVNKDLEPLRSTTEPGPHTVRIPVAHLDSWINALNQARLALHARHQITEEEMESHAPLNTDRGYVIFQIFVYGFLLDGLVNQVSGE